MLLGYTVVNNKGLTSLGVPLGDTKGWSCAVSNVADGPVFPHAPCIGLRLAQWPPVRRHPSRGNPHVPLA